MTTYYISGDGNNANNGLGPDASHATNKPWLTLGKALNTGSVVVPGDTIWIAPGIYFGQSATPIVGVASSGSPTSVRGDPLNSQGFRTAAGVLLAPGIVWLTTRTAVEGMDGASAASTNLIAGSTNGTNGLRWYDMVLDAGQLGSTMTLSLAANADWLFERCVGIGNNFIGVVGAPTATRNLTVRGCVLFCSSAFNGGTTAAATADADLAVLFESNLIYGRLTGSNLSLGTGGGNVAGGVRYKGNTQINVAGGTTAISTTAGNVSTVTPLRLEGNIITGNIGVSAGTAGHVVSDGYNRFFTYSGHVNFTEAGTDVRNAAPALLWPVYQVWGLTLPDSFALGWSLGSVATQYDSAWTPTFSDFRGRTARPWGAGAAIGYIESGNVMQDTGGAISGGGSNSLKLAGGGEMALFVAVDAVATMLTIYTESTTYGGTNYPQFTVEANPALGVVAQTATATDATEQQLTLTFTPTSPGVVELRLVSRSTSTTSATFFDRLVRA